MSTTPESVLDRIEVKGRPCAVIVGEHGDIQVWGVRDVKGRESVRVERAFDEERLIGVYTPDCPPEWIAEDLRAESWQLRVAQRA